jgi:hypothetical protein
LRERPASTIFARIIAGGENRSFTAIDAVESDPRLPDQVST